MTKRNLFLCLGLAILLILSIAFFLVYPHTTGPVIRLNNDTRIQSVAILADGSYRVWFPETETDLKKEQDILNFLSTNHQRHMLPNHKIDWTNNVGSRQYMIIVIQNGSRLVTIDISNNTAEDSPFNIVSTSGLIFSSRGYLLTPSEIRSFVESTLDESDYTIRNGA